MLFLGMTFVVSGVGKLLSYSSVAYPSVLDVLPPVLVQAVLPCVEIGIGALLILGIGIRFAAGLSTVLIVGFVISNILMITQGLGAEPCNCFGVNGQLTIASSLILDAIMAGLVAAIFVCYRGSFFNTTPLALTTGHKAKSALSLGAPKA